MARSTSARPPCSTTDALAKTFTLKELARLARGERTSPGDEPFARVAALAWPRRGPGAPLIGIGLRRRSSTSTTRSVGVAVDYEVTADLLDSPARHGRRVAFPADLQHQERTA